MIVSFISSKGGTGKTSTCVNIAGYLAKTGKKVLVLDLDPQASATSALGVGRGDIGEDCSQSLFDHEKRIRSTVFRVGGLDMDLVPSLSGRIFSEVEEGFLSGELVDLKETYDYVLIDTPPGFNFLSREAIMAADTLLSVFDFSIFAYENLGLLKEWVRDSGKELEIGVVNELNVGDRSARRILRDIASALDPTFFVPFDKRVFGSQATGVPLSHTGKRSKALKAYGKIADFISGGYNGNKKR